MPDLQSWVRPTTEINTPRSHEPTFEPDLFPGRLYPRYRSVWSAKIAEYPARRGSPEDYYPSHESSRARSCAPVPRLEIQSPMPTPRYRRSKHSIFPCRCSNTKKRLL